LVPQIPANLEGKLGGEPIDLEEILSESEKDSNS